MTFNSGTFHDYRQHHPKWFSVFRGRKVVEVWLGNNWYSLDWSSR